MMLKVLIAEDAKIILTRQLTESGLRQPVIYIYQQLKSADVVRGEDGGVNWTIDRPKAWNLNTVTPPKKMPKEEIIQVEGIPVYLVVVEPTFAIGVVIKAKNGQVFIEPYYS